MQLLNPYPDIRPDHPVLLREVRLLSWLQHVGSPVRFLIHRALVVLALVLVFYIGWLIWQWFMPGSVSNLYDRASYWFSDATLNFIILAGGLSLVASLPMDYASITAALNSINSELISGTWDLLRLTEVREGELVLAKHAGAQLRAWRGMSSVMGLRIAVGFIIAILFTDEFMHSSGRFGLEGGSAFQYVVFNLVPLALVYGIYVLEPLWRMRAVTALGMVISARSSDVAVSALSALGALLVFWLAQAVIVIAAVAGFAVLLFSIAMFGVGALCAQLLILVIVFPMIYGFYAVLKTWSLRQVARRVASYTR